MRFPRQTKIFRGQLDVAPFAGVFFLLILFVLLQSSLVFTPGVPIQLPHTRDLPGTGHPTVVVAIDGNGQLYFDNQIITEAALKTGLQRTVANAREKPTLVLQADRHVSYEKMIALSLLADEAGIETVLLATRPPQTPLPITAPDAK